jgi:hypothetical protein
VLVIGVAIVGALLWQQRSADLVASRAPATPEPAPKAESTTPPAPRYPIEPVAEAVPPLDGSDEGLVSALQSLWPNGGGLASWLVTRDIVRNFVATVDNVPRRTIPMQRVPLKPLPGVFRSTGSGDGMGFDAANAARYQPYVSLLTGVDMTRLVQLYVHNYPLFQQAYRDLGYPNGHFNDRLVEAIDVMLATPEQRAPVRLVQPKIFYEFADRDLEKLPAGQKLMLRMGPENAAVVKKKLTELRALVTARNAPVADKAAAAR